MPILAKPSVHSIIIDPGFCPSSISKEQSKAGPRAVYPFSLKESRSLIIGSVVILIGEFTI